MSADDKVFSDNLREVPEEFRNKWQAMLNTIAEVIHVPVALVNRAVGNELLIISKNTDERNPFDEGMSFPLVDGVYCEHVIKTHEELLIPNALLDPEWQHSPDLEYGLLAYIGLPLIWPEGQVFGTICLLDTVERTHEDLHRNLFKHFADSVNKDLATIVREKTLRDEINEHLHAKNALDDSTSLYQDLFENAGDAIFYIGLDGKILDANKVASRRLGYTHEELLGMHIRDFTAPSSQAGIPRRMKEILEKGRKIFSVEHVTKNGTIIPVEITTSLIDHHGKQTVLAIVHDITKRVRIESALGEREALLKEAQRIAKVGNWTWDFGSEKVTWSEEVYRIFGKREEDFEVTYENFLSTIHPDDRAKVENAVNTALENHTSYDVEYRIVLADGMIRHANSWGELLLNDRGEPIKMVGVVQDITERRDIEENLRESERQRREAQEAANIGSWEWQIEIDRLLYSEEMQNIYQLSSDVALDYYSYIQLVHPADRDLVAKAAQFAIENHEPYRATHRIIRGDGEIRTIDAHGKPFINEHGSVVRITGTVQDITERIKTEEALKESESQLREAQRIAHVGNWILEMDANSLQFSDEMYAIFGVSQETDLSSLEKATQFVHPDDREEMGEQISIAINSKSKYSIDHRIIRPNGELRRVSVRGEVVCNHANEPVYIIGTMQDVTDTYKLQEDIRESNERFKSIVEDLGDNFVAYRHDFHRKLLYASPGILTMFEIDHVGAIGKSIMDIVHWTRETVLDMRQNFVTLMRQGHVYNREAQYFRSSGELRTVSINSHLGYDANANAQYIEGIIEDITERKNAEIALAKSEQQLREAQRIARIGNWIFDVNARTIEFSDSAYEIYGVDPASPPDFDTMLRMIHDEDREMVIDLQNESIRRNIRLSLSHRFVQPSGTIVHVQVEGEPRLDNNGTVTQIIGTVQDISERVKVEAELADSERRLAEAEHLAGLGNLVFDIRKQTLSWSDELYNIFGTTKEEFGHSFDAMMGFVPEEDHPLLFEALDSMVRAKKRVFMTHRIRRPDGHIRYIRFDAYPILDAVGEPYLIFGTCQDITEREKMAQELLSSHDRYKSLIDDLGDNFVVYQHTLDGILTFASPGLLSIFGLDPEAAIGNYYIDLINWSDESRKDLPRNVQRVQEFGRNENNRYTFVHPDGSERTININAHLMRDEAGQGIGVEGIVEDITARASMEQELLRSRDRYKSLIDDMGDNFVVYRRKIDGTITFISPGVTSVFGISADDALGKPLQSFVKWTDETLKKLPAVVNQLNEAGHVNYEEASFIHPDGFERTLSVNNHIVRDEEGNAIAIKGILEDITEWKKAEEIYRKEEERFKLAVNATQDGLWDVNYETKQIYASPRWKEMFGLASTEDPPSIEEWRDLLHPDDRDRVVSFMESFFAGDDERYDLEFRMQHRNGNWIEVQSRAKVIRDVRGKPVRTIGTDQDITRQKRLAEELQVFRLMAENSGQGFGIATTDGKIYYMNPTLIGLLKAGEKEDYIGGDFRQFYSQEIYDRVEKEVLPTLFSQGQWNGELELISRDGKTIPTIENYALIRDDRGRPSYITDVITPISDIKEKEEQLEHARNEAESASQSKSDFLANVSHEIRTPMNAIIGMSHLALNTALTPKQHDYLSKIDYAAKSLLDIINDVLDFSRIESGKLELEERNFSIDDIIDRAIELVSVEVGRKGLELLVDCDSTIPAEVMGDSLRLTQVLNNLLSNAAKFTEEGEIFLGIGLLRKDDKSIDLLFSVADTGIGIEPEVQDRLFDIFTQADGSTTRKYGGTGLGLTICKQLVELMGGSIQVESQPGIGSKFSFNLKFKLAPERNTEEKAFAMPQMQNGGHILIIDDSEMASNTLASYLIGMGFEVDIARSGSIVVEKFKKQETETCNYDLLLIDLHIPGIDGIETSRQISDSCNCTIPRLLMASASWKNKIIQEALDAGFTGILTKPIRPRLLADTIQQLFADSTHEGISTSGNRDYLIEKKFGTSRILLVEDNDINLEVAKELLKEMGLTVITACNGIEALRVFNEQDFDLILMDIAMPEMDGLTATREIRALHEPKAKSIPIVAMTAHAVGGDPERCLEAGMNGYIPKPIDPTALQETLEQWLAPLKSSDRLIFDVPVLDLDKPWLRTLEKHGIEASDALKVIKDNEKFFIKMLRKYPDEYFRAPAQVQTLLKDEKYEEAHLLVHSIKSVSGYIGASALWNASVALEVKIKEHNKAAVKELEHFFKEMNNVVAVIKQAIEEMGTE